MSTIAELSSRVAALTSEINDMVDRQAQIKGQIDKAKATLHLTGEYADPDWFRRARGALRHLAAERLEAQGELAEVKRQLRAANVEASRDLFRKAVMETVDALTWERIISRAEDLREAVKLGGES